jgi:SAM-dependent methyltransferase
MDSTTARHKRDWNELAEFDPYWAVLTRRDRKNGGWDLDEFFATGEAEVGGVLERCGEQERPARWDRALDYGCGVGRLTRAASKRFGECVGVDISDRMVARAREINADHPSCTFVVGNGLDLRDFEAESFDFVYCSLVLQHLPELSRAEHLIAEFLRIVRPDGIAVFQMPSRIEWWARPRFRRRLFAALRAVGVGSRFLIGRFRSNPMRMNALSKEQVGEVVGRAGGRVVASHLDPEAPSQFNSVVYYAVRSS